MVTPSEIEQQRSPRALRDFVLELKDSVHANEAERHRGILKQGLYKEFLDEIVPLSLFALQVYPKDYQIKPVLGNQGYDALVFDETGTEVDRIEMTSPHDGNTDAKDAQLVVNRGFGHIYISTPGDDFDALFSHVLRICRKKAENDYNDCTLVVAIEPWTTIAPFEAKYESQIAALTNEMAQIKFKVKRVFLLVMPDRLVEVHFC